MCNGFTVFLITIDLTNIKFLFSFGSQTHRSSTLCFFQSLQQQAAQQNAHNANRQHSDVETPPPPPLLF
ncbi:hypothetical protein DERF_005508 [Dermatophagoides farinae]|uniref:Uncharacterized protein n=1 Tax=Dermatophagoides farinae TaxID=6954 RepID=A0A922L6N1_DERFA|nr:hypothetical protein DERF_005508 [Dermatophagoides farinae]